MTMLPLLLIPVRCNKMRFTYSAYINIFKIDSPKLQQQRYTQGHETNAFSMSTSFAFDGNAKTPLQVKHRKQSLMLMIVTSLQKIEWNEEYRTIIMRLRGAKCLYDPACFKYRCDIRIKQQKLSEQKTDANKKYNRTVSFH